MRRALGRLLLHLGLCAAGVLAAIGIAALFQVRVPLPIPFALALAAGTLWWIADQGAERADPLDAPELDLDADFALPHGQDMRVRRLEDLIHGAQPNRRMTARGLARILGEIAEERARDPEARPLSPDLRALIETAREPDGAAHPVGPIDRRTLHRCLTELAPREERDR